MQISGSIPMHVARAYGLPSANVARGTPAATPVAPTRAIDGSADEPNSKLRELIGSTVRGGIDFNSASPAGSGSFQLYTRAADKIEAAVGVQLGRAIDVKG